MATLTEGVQGLSEEEATKRLIDAMDDADHGLRRTAEMCVRVEKARAGSRPRERGRRAYKYGATSAPAQRAEPGVRVQEAVLDAAVAELQHARSVTPWCRDHARARPRRGSQVAGIPEVSASSALGKTSRRRPRTNGYFPKEVEATCKPGQSKTASGRIVMCRRRRNRDRGRGAPRPHRRNYSSMGAGSPPRPATARSSRVEPGQALYLGFWSKP
jgi:hypothetical protein